MFPRTSVFNNSHFYAQVKQKSQSLKVAQRTTFDFFQKFLNWLGWSAVQLRFLFCLLSSSWQSSKYSRQYYQPRCAAHQSLRSWQLNDSLLACLEQLPISTCHPSVCHFFIIFPPIHTHFPLCLKVCFSKLRAVGWGCFWMSAGRVWLNFQRQLQHWLRCWVKLCMNVWTVRGKREWGGFPHDCSYFF